MAQKLRPEDNVESVLGVDSGRQAWCQEPLPTEPSRRSEKFGIYQNHTSGSSSSELLGSNDSNCFLLLVQLLPYHIL